MGPQMTAHVAVVGISLAPRLSSVYLGHLPWKGRRPPVARSGVSARRGSDYPAVCSSCIPAGPPHELRRDLTPLSPHTSPGRTYYYPHFTEEGTRPEK